MKSIATIILVFFVVMWLIMLSNIPSNSSKKPNATLVTDIEVTDLISLDELTTEEKKKIFIEQVLPAIVTVKNKLDEQYDEIYQLSLKKDLSSYEQGKLNTLKKRYRVPGVPCLLTRLHTHPVSIVLAQAALETGWGTSRFYNEANNIFGVWSFNPHEPRMAAGETRGMKTIYVKKYVSLEESIEGYFRMIAMGKAYKTFREARKDEPNPFKLIRHLTHYSELREEYVKRLYYVMKTNRFYRYDSPSFKPIALRNILPRAIVKKPIPLPDKTVIDTMQDTDCDAEFNDTEPVLSNETNLSVNTISALPVLLHGIYTEKITNTTADTG